MIVRGGIKQEYGDDYRKYWVRKKQNMINASDTLISEARNRE